MGSGYAANRRRSLERAEAVEIQALIDFVTGRGIDGIIDLHACGSNFAIQARSHEAPYWSVLREWQRRAEGLFAAKRRKLRPLYGDGDPPEPPSFHFNAALLHKFGELLFMAYEGRQGYLGNRAFWPLPTEWEIIDDYLAAVQVFLELGAEEWYSKANRETFGG